MAAGPAGRGVWEAVCGISPFGLWSSALGVRAELVEQCGGRRLAVARCYSCNMIARRLAEWWSGWLYGRALAIVQVGERGRVASWLAYLLVTVACDCRLHLPIALHCHCLQVCARASQTYPPTTPTQCCRLLLCDYWLSWGTCCCVN